MVQKLKTIKLYNGDIPKNLDLGNSIAVDTETMGLNINNDRLCLIQISSKNGECHIIVTHSADELSKSTGSRASIMAP